MDEAARAEFSGSHLPVFSIQLVREGAHLHKRRAITEVSEVATIFKRFLQHADREHFVMLMLDAKAQSIGLHTVSVGTLTSALVSPREVFKAAILANAAGIIVAHNHPSGDPTPSPEDIEVTKKLKEVGEMLDICVHDHIVVGDAGQYVSMRERKLF